MLSVRPLVVADGYVVGGNMRLLALKELGYREVEVIDVSDWTKAQRDEFMIKDNLSFGDWDYDLLANEWNIDDLTEWGMDLWDTEPEEMKGLTDEDQIPEAPEKPTTKLGDIWILGEHRVMCGDSTKTEDVDKLMDGNKADMVFTSPPYNSGGKSGTGGYRGNKKRTTKEFYNQCEDNLSSKEYKSFLVNVLKQIDFVSNEDSPILWNVMYNANSRDDYGKIVFSNDNPFTVKETIIWDKGVGMNITSTGILSRTCELVFLMSRGEKYFTNQNNEVFWNTWRISNKGGGNMKHGHGASFPVELPQEGIVKFSKKDSVIYEPFLGSGTTLIASQKTGRKCYGMELDPKYCDVIVKRWEDFTGKKAHLEEEDDLMIIAQAQ